MADVVTRVYRNDSEQEYNVPGVGWIGPGQRVSISSEFPPPLNLVNFPGLVDVLDEEVDSETPNRDYEATPEPAYTEPVAFTSTPVGDSEPTDG